MVLHDEHVDYRRFELTLNRLITRLGLSRPRTQSVAATVLVEHAEVDNPGNSLGFPNAFTVKVNAKLVRLFICGDRLWVNVVPFGFVRADPRGSNVVTSHSVFNRRWRPVAAELCVLIAGL